MARKVAISVELVFLVPDAVAPTDEEATYIATKKLAQILEPYDEVVGDVILELRESKIVERVVLPPDEPFVAPDIGE